ASVAMILVACRIVSVPAAWWVAFALESIALASSGRGALLCILASVGVLWLLNPWARRLNVRVIGLIGAFVLILAALAVLDLNFGAYRDRELGPRQLFLNAVGSFTDSGSEALDGTRAWRE